MPTPRRGQGDLHTLWRKVWADLWLARSRSLLAAINIAAGVFCVGTLFGMIDLQLSKMDASHRQSQPSHINLILRGEADTALLAQIKALPGVADVDAMSLATVQFRQSGESDWRLATLIMRPDYTLQRYDKTGLAAGDWPTGGKVCMENLSAAAMGIKIADTIEFNTAQGSQALAIAGILRHPFVKPPKFGGQLHFFIDSSSAALFGMSNDRFRQLLVQISPPYSADKASAVAGNIRGFLLRHGEAVSVTLLQDPDKHWGRPFLAGVNGVLQIMALLSLALASMLILNTLSAHIAQQTDQIGVMKALGARTFTVAKIFVYQTLLLALTAIILALPFGLAAAHFGSCRLLALFNIDCGGFTYSERALILMLLGGLLAPLLAALGPIWRGAAMNVREALSSYGLGADFGYGRFDMWLERLGARYLPTLYAAAWGNLFRRKGRLLLTQAALIVAGVMFLVLMSLIASLNLTLDNEMTRSRYALRLGFGIDQSTAEVMAVVASVAGVEQAEVWRRLPLEMTQNGAMLRQKGSLGAQLLALPADSTMYQPLIESGRWLRADDAGQRVMVISADTAAGNGIQAGDVVEADIGQEKQKWRVIGTYRWLAGSNYTVEPVYAPLETLNGSTRRADEASMVLLKAPLATLEEEADYLDAMTQRFQDRNIKLDAYTTQAKLEQRRIARNQFQPVIGMLMGLASLIAVVGGIGLSGALAIGVLQRTREIGVLRAIGAPSKAVFRLFLLEGLFHGMVAGLLSAPLAYLAAEPIAHQLGKTMLGMQLDFRFDRLAVFEWLMIVLALVLLASYWPARKAANLTIRACLAHA